MAAMILGILSVLAVICVKSVASDMVILQENMAANLGLESVFSEYLRPLFDEYAIFGFECKGKKDFEDKYEEYMSYNLDEEKGTLFFKSVFHKGSIDKISCEKLASLTDEEGNLFMEQAVEFMKYKVPESVIEYWLNITEKLDDDKTAKEVYETYYKTLVYTADIDEKVMKIVECIDGIKNNQIIALLKKLDTELVLINLVYYTPATMGIIKSAGYKKIVKEIKNEVANIEKNLATIKKLVPEIDDDCVVLEKKAKMGLEDLENKKIKLSAETYEAYRDRYQELIDYKSNIKVVDLDTILTAVDNNLEIIKECEAVEELGNLDVNIDSLKDISEQIHGWEEKFSKLSYDGLEHRYEGTVYSSKENAFDYNKILKVLSEGIMTLVFPKDTAISGKYLKMTDLASDVEKIKQTPDNSDFKSDTDIIDTILFDEYIMEFMSCYGDETIDSSLDYQIEYILNGSRSDYDNLKAMVSKLMTVRLGFALTSIMRDDIRKEEALALSTVTLGITLCEGLIKLGQVVIIYVWANGEAVNDVRLLLKGNKVALIKTPTNWKTSLKQVLNADFKEGESDKDGIDYRGYLRILLLICGKEKKIYRTMDMVEMGLNDKGYKNIRLSKLYSKVYGKIKFNTVTKPYIHTFEYKY